MRWPALLAAALLAGCAIPGPLRPADQRLLARRTVVVTGASSGFGRAVAVKLGRAHANVVLAARRADVLEQVAAEVRAAGGAALVAPTDVSDGAAVEALAEAAVARFGRIDVWINDAGTGAIGRFWEIPAADHARVVAVNLDGVIFGSHAALTRFVRQGHGVLVNVSSVEGKLPAAYHASYAATKHAIVGLDNALVQELRLSGVKRVRVSTVLPWAADTPWFTHAANYSGGTGRMILLDQADRVADAIVWAAVHPKRELAVGMKARGAVTAARLFPGLSQRVAGGILHRQQMELAAPTPPTDGALFRPTAAGAGVGGGVRERMRREDAARKAGGTPGRPAEKSGLDK